MLCRTMAAFTRLEPDARRQEILGAARRVFLRTDFATTSMGEIAEEAGVTRGLLNHYFGTKRDLYLAVVADVASTLPAMVDTTLRDLPREEMVARNAENFLDAMERDVEVWTVLLGAEALARDPEVVAVMTAARDEVVERMVRNHGGDDAPDELRMALRVFQGAAETIVKEWLQLGRMSREQAQAILTGLLLALVRDVVPSIPRDGA
jgi:AcrR family transcriptional regulator